MFKRRFSATIFGAGFALTCWLAPPPVSAQDAAVWFEPSPPPSGGTPSADSMHGWRFTPTEDIIVTHLGVYAEGGAPMSIEHPIGIWHENTNALEVEGTLAAGSGTPLIDDFRYVEVDRTSLSRGETYVVAYYSATSNTDRLITNAQGMDRSHAAVGKLPGALWMTSTGGLRMPTNSTGADRYGPNFRFVTGDPELRIRVSGACPGLVTVDWEHATPNRTSGLVFARNEGSFTISGGPCDGTQLGLGTNQLQLVRTFNSGANGSGSMSGNAGVGACGAFLQVVVADGQPCDTSNVGQIP